MLKFLFICILSQANGFALYLTKQHCDREINEGIVMMGNALTVSSDRNLTVVGDRFLQSGERIGLDPSTHVSTGLQVSLSPKSSQSVIEIKSTAMRFKGGFCNGTRVVQKGELEFIPQVTISATFQIALVGAWASSYSSGVRFTSEFVLHVEVPSLIQTSSSDNDL